MELAQAERARRPGSRGESAGEPSLAVDAVAEEGRVVAGGRRTKMPRPCKMRRIRGRPNSSYFKPAGVRLSEVEESMLSLPEFEVIRLVDSKGTSQEEAAAQMRVSQSTLSRILKSARYKMADALTNGKAIRIEKDEE